MSACDPLQPLNLKRVFYLMQDFDAQFEEQKARSRKAFIRRRRYVGFFVFAILTVFVAMSLLAGVYYYRQAPIGQAILITASLVGVGVVEWFALTRNRKRDRPIPDPLLHGISGILVIVLISAILALT
jgi:FtsH-binding integral membrane protein